MKSDQLEEINVSKLVDLKRVVAEYLNGDTEEEFPKAIAYSRGIEFPKYKITIEKVDEDYFIDSKGVKWVKVQAGALSDI